MKKIMNWMLMALLVVGASMNLTSCKDDELTEDEKQQQAEQELTEALEWWNVVSQLTDVQELPADWQKATFEPTVGKALESDPYTRVVSTNDLATAAQRFAYLTGANVDEATADYTWNHKDAGSLTYHAGSPAGTYLAQVDVNLKQMPKLKKILYQTPDQMGENASGSFSGTAYYRFGDVVRKQNGDGDWDYWVCVRPAFSLEGKGDSHWICVNNLPKKNIYTYSYADDTWELPTKLGESKEHMQNFAELLYAIADPDQYYANLADLKLKTFHDFGREKFNTYHSKAFWKRVSDAWKSEKIYSKVFSYDDVIGYAQDNAINMIENVEKGLNFVYKGYSWMFGWNCTLWRANYKGINLKTATYTTMKIDMRDAVYSINAIKNLFETIDPHFIVRYATGEELCKDVNGKKAAYSVKNQLSNCEDVYVYNKFYYSNLPNGMYDLGSGPETDDDIAHPENTQPIVSKPLSKVTKADRGKFIGLDGMIYESRRDAQRAGTKPVALVIDTFDTLFTCVTEKAMLAKNIVYERSDYGAIRTGIGIALEDGNRSGTNKTDKDFVLAEDFDPTWYNANQTETGTWLVPNVYHWQRLVLPYMTEENKKDRVIKLQDYFYEHLSELEQYAQTDISGSERLLKELSDAGAPLKNGTYLIANGMCWDDDNEKAVPYAISSISATNEMGELQWSYNNRGNNVRYVLVW